MDEQPINLRVLLPEHAAEMSQIHAQCFNPSWPRSDFIDHIKRPSDLTLGCFEGQVLCGYIILRLAADQAEILTLAIQPDSRRKGHGGQLISQAEILAKQDGIEIIFLDVAEDNRSAIKLYSRHHYQYYAKRPGYYRRLIGEKAYRISALSYQKRL